MPRDYSNSSGDDAPQDKIEKALLKRALGFKQQEIYSEDVIDRKTGECTEQAKRKIVTKEVPPDVRALLFWLKNRRPRRWREKIEPPDDSCELEFSELDEKL